MKSQRSSSQSSPRWRAVGARRCVNNVSSECPFDAHLVKIMESRAQFGFHHQRSEFDNLGLLWRRERLDRTHIMVGEYEARQNFAGYHFREAFLSLANFGRHKNFSNGRCRIKL